MEETMKPTKIYDVPTRLFHWIFVTLFLGAFIIGKTVDDDSAAFPYHMILGMALAMAVLLRIVWGFVGSKYARFSSFELNPRSLLFYFKNIMNPKALQSAGHNPASSWAAIIMMGLALVLAGSGILMARDINKETLEEIHELAANAFVLVAIAHVLGLIFHQIKFRDQLGLSMISGHKQAIGPNAGIERSYTVTGVVFAAFIGMFVLALNHHYNATTGVLDFHGFALQLSEGDDDGGNHDENDD
jgi:cytochrome b